MKAFGRFATLLMDEEVSAITRSNLFAAELSVNWCYPHSPQKQQILVHIVKASQRALSHIIHQ